MLRTAIFLSFVVGGAWWFQFIRGEVQHYRMHLPPDAPANEHGYQRYEHGAWRWHRCDAGPVDLFCEAWDGRVTCDGAGISCTLNLDGSPDGGVYCSEGCTMTVSPRSP